MQYDYHPSVWAQAGQFVHQKVWCSQPCFKRPPVAQFARWLRSIWDEWPFIHMRLTAPEWVNQYFAISINANGFGSHAHLSVCPFPNCPEGRNWIVIGVQANPHQNASNRFTMWAITSTHTTDGNKWKWHVWKWLNYARSSFWRGWKTIVVFDCFP